MGSYFSTLSIVSGSRRSSSESNGTLDIVREPQHYKVLVFGKTDLFKRDIKNHDFISAAEYQAYRGIIYQNVLENTQMLVQAMKSVGMEPQTTSNQAFANEVSSWPSDFYLGYSTELLKGVAESIAQLWNDPATQRAVNMGMSLKDNTRYFFSEVRRIASPEYIPTRQDIQWARKEKAGIVSVHHTEGERLIHIFDIGDHLSERTKLPHYLDSAASIVFCVSLDWYDEVLERGRDPASLRSTRLAESLFIFESLLKLPSLLHTKIFLFLVNLDELESKLNDVPLDQHFSEYDGGNDVNKTAEFILGKFVAANRRKLALYSYFIRAPHAARSDVLNLILSSTLDDLAGSNGDVIRLQ